MQNLILSYASEIMLITTIIIGQILDIFKLARIRTIILLAFCGVTLALILNYISMPLVSNNHELITDSPNLIINWYFNNAKNILLLLLSLMLISCYGYCYIDYKRLEFEYITIILIAGVGALIALYAKDLLILFLSLELQTLAGYLLVSFRKDNLNATSASIKYFILGSCITCFMLLGISFIYGFAGTINYIQITQILYNTNPMGLNIGLSLLIFSLLFKIGAAPLHIWVMDVYEGSNILTLLFFNLISKITGLGVLYQIIQIAPNLAQALIIIFASTSLIIGSIGGLQQLSIKRLLGYSSILTMGFALLPLLADTPDIKTAFNYLVIYALSTTAFIMILISTNRKNIEDINFLDISSIGIKHKYSGMALSIIIFSMIGIPPFAGFFIKYNILLSLMNSKQYYLAVLALLCTLISTFYYLRIIKTLYFTNKPNDSTKFFMPKVYNLIVSIIILYLTGYILIS